MDLEYIIQFIYPFVYHTLMFPTLRYEQNLNIIYIYIRVYLKTLKKWYVFQLLIGEGQGTFESQKPFPSPTFIRRLNCQLLNGSDHVRLRHVNSLTLFCSVRLRPRTMSFPCKSKDFVAYAVLSWFSDFVHCCFTTTSLHMFYTQRSRYF